MTLAGFALFLLVNDRMHKAGEAMSGRKLRSERLHDIAKRADDVHRLGCGVYNELATGGNMSALMPTAALVMVFQNVYLFNDTAANNIRFGKPDATLAELRAAARPAE